MYKLVLILSIVCFSCRNSHKNPHVVITTNYGVIEAELFPERAPKTVAAFLSYVDSGLYKNSSFYRVLFVESPASNYNFGLIQGGIWQSNTAKATTLPGIPHESPKQTGLSHTDGTISLARGVAGSANSEFFICVGDQTQYDSSQTTNPDGLGFAAFGRVTSGMDIVREIHSQPSNGQSFVKPIVITSIKRLQ
jgi:peptidyl-prolyl cis-trans isomerase A (cyclophilin A)